MQYLSLHIGLAPVLHLGIVKQRTLSNSICQDRIRTQSARKPSDAYFIDFFSFLFQAFHTVRRCFSQVSGLNVSVVNHIQKIVLGFIKYNQCYTVFTKKNVWKFTHTLLRKITTVNCYRCFTGCCDSQCSKDTHRFIPGQSC